MRPDAPAFPHEIGPLDYRTAPAATAARARAAAQFAARLAAYLTFPAPHIDHQLDTLVKLDAQGPQHSCLCSSTLIFCRLVQAIPSTDQGKLVTGPARHPRKAARRSCQ